MFVIKEEEKQKEGKRILKKEDIPQSRAFQSALPSPSAGGDSKSQLQILKFPTL